MLCLLFFLINISNINFYIKWLIKKVVYIIYKLSNSLGNCYFLILKVFIVIEFVEIFIFVFIDSFIYFMFILDNGILFIFFVVIYFVVKWIVDV